VDKNLASIVSLVKRYIIMMIAMPSSAKMFPSVVKLGNYHTISIATHGDEAPCWFWATYGPKWADRCAHLLAN